MLADYEQSLISLGGGVFSRSLKAIPLALEVAGLLDLDKPQATLRGGDERPEGTLDLLWFGASDLYPALRGKARSRLAIAPNDPIVFTGCGCPRPGDWQGANLARPSASPSKARREGIAQHRRHRPIRPGSTPPTSRSNLKIGRGAPRTASRLSRAPQQPLSR